MDSARDRLILEAVVSYANSCTLPDLTPTCPFYESTEDGPRCGEQCRGVAESLGDSSAAVETHDVDGLRFTGRALSLGVVAGVSDFDATQVFLEDFRSPLLEQRTASLLLLLRTCIVGSALEGPESAPAAPVDVWGELLRRGLDVERLASGEFVRELAVTLAVSSVLDKLRAGPVATTSESLVTEQWASLLDARFQQEPQEQALKTRRSRPAFRPGDLRRLLRSAGFPEDFKLSPEDEQLLAHALSPAFLDRVVQWLVRLFSEDLEGALALSPPPPAVFDALPARNTADEVGTWLWERFTRTELDQWTPSSLALEWQWLDSGEAVCCDQRILRERALDKSEVASRALRRFAQPRSSTPSVSGLSASDFVNRASELLVNGEWKAATAIFEGLAELRPGDGEAWNNLGFCLLAADADHALVALRRARSLSVRPKLLTVANEMLALHLLGRDQECLRLHSAVESATEDAGVVLRMWMHPAGDDEDELELAEPQSLSQYVEDLLRHVRTGTCSTRRSPAG